MALNETIFAVVSDQGVDFVTRLHLPKGLGILYNRGLAASNCPFLAGVGEVVVAGNIIPLAVLVPDDHHAVFSSREEAVWLVGSPVLVLQSAAVGPAEVVLKHLVIEADPLVIVAQTIHKHLFLVRQDAGEMGALQTALPLSRVPRAPVGKVFVALPLELVPAVVTGLSVLFAKYPDVAWETEASECIKTIHARGSVPTGVRVTLIKIEFTLVSAVSRHTGAHVGSFGRVAGAPMEARVCLAPIRSW